MSNQIQITGGAKVRALDGVITGTSGVLSSVPYGGANGVATLDSAGKIPVSQLPNSVMEYKGTWNVATNTPYLVNGTGNAGDVYMVTGAAVGGTNHDFGAGNILFYNGDQAIYDGSAWQRASGSSGTVTSVALSAPSAFNVTGSPITTSGTLTITGAGTTSQYINGTGGLTTFPSLTGFVPYTGATNDLNLGTHNFYANNFFDGFTNVAASGTQIVLTIASTPSYTITGSGGQTIKLPDATTLPNGAIFSFNNNQSSGAITINNNSNTLVVSVPSGGFAEVVLLDNSIAAGSWDRHFKAPSNVSWSTNTLDYAGSITSATWNGNVVAINRGGTGSSTQNFVDLTTTQTIGGAKTFSGVNTFTSSLYANNITFNNSGFTQVLQPATLSVNRTITLPNATGTLALTSDLSNYVPYTGATADVNLGTYAITGGIGTFTNGVLNGNGTNPANLYLKKGSFPFFTNAGNYGLIAAVSSSFIFVSDVDGTNYKYASFNLGSLTNNTNRAYTLPNASGTLALTSDINYPVTSVFGRTGAVVATSGDYTTTQVTEGTNLYYTDARARASVSLTTTGSSGSSTYSNTTGIFNIPTYTLTGLGGQPLATNLTSLSGLTYASASFVKMTAAGTFSLDTNTYYLASNPSGFTSNVGTVTSVAALTLGTTGTDVSSSVATGTTTPVITLNIPTASATNRGALSSADWATFNGKQSALTNPVTGTGTSGQVTYFNGTSTITGSSNHFWDATNNRLGIGTNTPSAKLDIFGAGDNTYFNVQYAGGQIASIEAVGTSVSGYAKLNLGKAGTTNVVINGFGDSYFTGGNLGVGINSPSYRLHVSGTLGVTGASTLSSTLGVTGVSTFSSNIYMQSSGNPTQLLVKGTNTEFWVDSYYGGGSSRAFINRNGTSNQSSLMFTTGYSLTNGTAWSGSNVDWSMGMSNDATNNFYIAYGDFYSSSNRAITISSSRNVLIGTSTDSGYKLDVTGTGRFTGTTTIQGYAGFQYNSAGTYPAYNTYYGAIGHNFSNSLSEVDFWNTVGGGFSFRKQTGASAQTELLSIAASGAATFSSSVTAGARYASTIGTSELSMSGTGGYNSASYIQAYNTDTNTFKNLTFYGNTICFLAQVSTDSERMRITSGGELYWNLTGTAAGNLNTGGALFRNNIGKYIQLSTGLTTDADLMIFYKSNGAGGVTNTGSITTSGNNTLYNITSDYRLKEDLKDFNGIEKILGINVYDFAWKSDKTRSYGVMAHELADILPYAVYGKKDEIQEDGEIQLQQVDYSKIVPILVKAIQEQQAQIEELKQQVQLLLNK